jgi:hypothetical protein
MPVFSKPLTIKYGQTSAYRCAARENVRRAVRAVLRGYKIEKSKVIPIRAKVEITSLNSHFWPKYSYLKVL